MVSGKHPSLSLTHFFPFECLPSVTSVLLFQMILVALSLCVFPSMPLPLAADFSQTRDNTFDQSHRCDVTTFILPRFDLFTTAFREDGASVCVTNK